MDNAINLKIGFINFCITCEYPAIRKIIKKTYKRYFAEEGNDAVNIVIHCKKFPEVVLRDSDFVYSGTPDWKFYKLNGKNVFIFYHPPPSRRLAVFDSKYKDGKIYLESIINPLEYPLLDFFLVNILLLRKGILLHACAAICKGKGILFAGYSGTGKTTIGNILRPGNIVLADECVAVQKVGKHYFMYGITAQNFKEVKQHIVKVDRIYIIQHAETNLILPLSHKTISILFFGNCSFLPRWDINNMVEYHLDFCVSMAEEIPCFLLGSKPTRDLSSAIENHEALLKGSIKKFLGG